MQCDAPKPMCGEGAGVLGEDEISESLLIPLEQFLISFVNFLVVISSRVIHYVISVVTLSHIRRGRK